jgi:hypothetical protein
MNFFQGPIVVYLCRYQDSYSADKFAAFINSYITHPAGCEHRLIIIRKGFELHETEWNRWVAPLKDIPFELRSYPDEYFVFGYFRFVLEDYPDCYVLFLNATSEILVDDWLLLYMKHAKENRVLGSGGTYSGLNSNHVKKKRCCRFSKHVKANQVCQTQCPYAVFNVNYYKYMLKRYVFSLIGKESIWDEFCNTNFYPYPCPMLRTNAFMVPPQFLKKIHFWPDKLLTQSKHVEFLFESGKYSLTIQAIIAGYEIFVCGANGFAYSITEWRESKTFRSYNQDNALIADHHVRCYDAASPRMKKHFEVVSYGKDKINLDAFYDLIKNVDVSDIKTFYVYCSTKYSG